MRGGSRASYAELRERLSAEARGVVTAGRVGDELFAVVRLLDDEHGLRRALADPTKPADEKKAIVARLLHGKVSAPTERLVTEAAAAHSQQQHGQVLAVGAKLAVALDDLHFPAVHQAGAAGGHPGFADRLGHLGTTLDRGQDLGIESIDFLAQVVDVGEWFCFDCHFRLRILVVWRVLWSHPVSGLTQETSPGSGSGPRGSGSS